MKPSPLTILFYFILTITSCTSPRYIDIQVLNPAEEKLPSNLEKLFVINSNKFTADSSDHKYKLFLNGYYDNLIKTLQESPLFEGCQFHLCNADSFVKVFKETSFTERKGVGYFSIDRLALEDKFLSGVNDYGFTISYQVLMFDVVSKFSKLSAMDNFINISNNDTLIWEFNDYNLYKNFLKQGKYYGEGGSKVGELFAHKMAPYWTTAERVIFYNNNKYMRKAYNAYLNNNIHLAIQTWKKLYDIGTNTLASYSAHNIAVCYEILDDLDLCEEWLKKSNDKRDNSITKQYIVEIVKRRANVIKLNKQMLLP